MCWGRPWVWVSGCLMGGGDGEEWSFTTLVTSHILTVQPPFEDHGHLGHYCWWQCHPFRGPGTKPIPNLSFPWLVFRYSETTTMLHLFISCVLDQKAQVFSHFHGVLEWEPFPGASSGMTQIGHWPSQGLALEARHRAPAVINRTCRTSTCFFFFFN